MRRIPVFLGVFATLACSGPPSGPAPSAQADGAAVETANRPPVILRLFSDLATVAPDGVATLRALASDADGDPLSFEWSASAGTLEASGPGARWRSPPGGAEAVVAVVVRDRRGGAVTAQIHLGVLGACDRILVDASHDGGVWWFPQVAPFQVRAAHQGKALADLLRSRGYTVDEVGRGMEITDALLSQYRMVIRATGFSGYTPGELEAYERYLRAPVSLLLVGDYLRPGWSDQLAEHLGVPFQGLARGTVARFADHPVTAGVSGLDYSLAGSAIVSPELHPDLEVLGWLSSSDFLDLDGDERRGANEPTGAAVMGVLRHPTARVFFLGELNGLEALPQPFTDNLLGWMFSCGGGVALHGP